MTQNLELFFSATPTTESTVLWSLPYSDEQKRADECAVIMLAKEVFTKQTLIFSYHSVSRKWLFQLKEKIYSVEYIFIERLMQTICKYGLRLLYKRKDHDDACTIFLKAPTSLGIKPGWEEKTF